MYPIRISKRLNTQVEDREEKRMRKEWMTVLYTLIPIFGVGFALLYTVSLFIPASPYVILSIWDIGMMISIYFRLKRIFAVREMLLEVKGTSQCSAVDLCRLLFVLADKYDGAAMTRDEIRSCADALFPFSVVTKAIQMEERGKKS